jgi:hypothetical protein
MGCTRSSKTLSIVALASVFLSAQTGRRPEGTTRTYRFEDYAVTEVWNGPPAGAKITSASKKMFRTNLSEAAQQPPNFAGHYRVAVWGCGTRCESGAVIDLKTGDVFHLPSVLSTQELKQWIYCTSVYDKGGLTYRTDSQLMVLKCGAGADEQGNNTPDTYYFRWANSHFHLLSHMSGSGKHSL